jgi:Mn-dependent DtxR family transcriptional regulator
MKSISTEAIRTALREIDKSRPGASIDPGEIARHLVGSDPAVWGKIMKPLRPALVQMAKDGEIELTRKGKPVAPEALRGVYRLRVIAPDSDDSPGH